MNFLGWIVYVPPGEDRERLFAVLPGYCCECLCLCAGAGCSCLSGEGERVCSEDLAGRLYPYLVCEGPGWSVTVGALERVVKIEVHYAGPLIGLETSELHRKIVSHGFPTFMNSTSGGDSL